MINYSVQSVKDYIIIAIILGICGLERISEHDSGQKEGGRGRGRIDGGRIT